jgi:hypothetical protein
LIPTKQLWGGNPVKFIKDLNLGEVWNNYTKSYIEVALGDAHKNEFTMWNSSYLHRQSSSTDAAPSENDLLGITTSKNSHRGVVKYYC